MHEKSIARAIAVYSATKLLTENAKLFTSLRPNEKDVIRVAKIFTDFIEKQNAEEG